MDTADTLNSLGFSLPSPAYLAGALLFGILGLATYRYGKKAELPAFKWTGVVLMLYPYFIAQTWLLYAVGVFLCLGLYLWHRYG
jgi:hypothetical protein